MPKQKITREMVVGAAFQLAREGGMERVLVKDIAARLGCSLQLLSEHGGAAPRGGAPDGGLHGGLAVRPP